MIMASVAFVLFNTASPQYVKQRLADVRNFSLSEDYSENGSCHVQNRSDPYFIIEQGIQADMAFWSMWINSFG